MVSKISQGVTVSVETFYQAAHSNVANNEYMFAYRISIDNSNSYPVRLLRRHWYIHDSIGNIKEVEGEGVIGVQPQINPSQSYQYISGCTLHTEIGKMYGTYLMENLYNKEQFHVIIPIFEMIVPFKMN